MLSFACFFMSSFAKLSPQTVTVHTYLSTSCLFAACVWLSQTQFESALVAFCSV